MTAALGGAGSAVTSSYVNISAAYLFVRGSLRQKDDEERASIFAMNFSEQLFCNFQLHSQLTIFFEINIFCAIFLYF